MAYLIQLRHFEGPLDLLLYLIRKEEMDIFDININEITKQFLEYIKIMKELDLEGAGDFIAMAATLIHIKSRMLLPQYNEEGEEIEPEDPRKELVQKLLEYQKFQEAGKNLYSRGLLNRDVWTRGTRERGLEIEGDEIELDDDGLFGLIASYRKVLLRAEKNFHKVKAKFQSIASRILEMKDALQEGTRVVLRDLLSVGLHAKQPRLQLLITFLSILELGRLGFVSLFQAETYGDIYIETKKPIDPNVLDRVQEFETQLNKELATPAVAILETEQMDLLVQENPSMETPSLSEEQILAAFEQRPDGSSLVEENLRPEDVATDEEIDAALAELDGVIADVSAEPSLEVAVETPAVVEPVVEELAAEPAVELMIETVAEIPTPFTETVTAAVSEPVTAAEAVADAAAVTISDIQPAPPVPEGEVDGQV